MASGIVAERRRAPSGDVKAALLGALFAAIPHRPLMRYGEHSCKKLRKAPKGEPMAGKIPCPAPMSSEAYLRDESRSVGTLRKVSCSLNRKPMCAMRCTPCMPQVCLSPCRARVSALAAGAVPHGRLRAEHVAHEPRARHAPRLRRPLLCARATGPFAHGAARHAAEGEFRHGGLER